MAESDKNKKGAGKRTGNEARRIFVQQARASVRFECEEDEPSTYDHDDSDEETQNVCSDGKEGSSAGPEEQQPDSNKKRSGFMNFLHRFNTIVHNITNRTAHSSWRKPQ